VSSLTSGGYAARNAARSPGSVRRTPSSRLPSVNHPACVLCARPNTSSLRVPGDRRSSSGYTASGLRPGSRTYAERGEQRREGGVI
jgi:hypothetical protein